MAQKKNDRPPEMTSKAMAAFRVYLDLGRTRTLPQVAQLMGYAGANGQLRRWSALYKWTQLCAEHDHAALREQLGQRRVDRESAMQDVIDVMPLAVNVLVDIMTNDQKLPVFDRQGNQVIDSEGAPVFRPMVRASTKAETAKTLLGIAGLVAVKRMEVKDTTSEALDEAAGLIEAMTPEQVAKVVKAMSKDDGS